MGSIEKLGILGIRSFGTDDISVVNFQKPLTIILGHNGAGKTSIVECLKYVITGELPPNSNKGQFFIHDPKMLNTATIKAQIRIIFQDQNHKRIAATRNLQLTYTKDKNNFNKATFKALESVLQTTTDEGKKISISQKCADMDVQIPRLLGVSKAVLENIIFCHQEESTWPLQETAKFKKKIDEIFGSERYAKAIENINQIKKQYSNKLKLFLQEYTYIKNEVENYKNIQSQMEIYQNKLNNEFNKLQENEKKLKENKNQLNKFENILETSQHNIQRIQSIQEILKNKNFEKKRIFGMLTEDIDEPIQTLEKINSETFEQIYCIQNEIKKNSCEIENLENNFNNLTNIYDDMLRSEMLLEHNKMLLINLKQEKQKYEVNFDPNETKNLNHEKMEILNNPEFSEIQQKINSYVKEEIKFENEIKKLEIEETEINCYKKNIENILENKKKLLIEIENQENIIIENKVSQIDVKQILKNMEVELRRIEISKIDENRFQIVKKLKEDYRFLLENKKILKNEEESLINDLEKYNKEWKNEKKISEIITTKKLNIENKKEELEIINKEIGYLEKTIDNNEKELNELNNENIDEYEKNKNIIKEYENDLIKIQNKIDILNEHLNSAHKLKECNLCDRKMKITEIKTFIEKLKNEIKFYKDKLNSIQILYISKKEESQKYDYLEIDEKKKKKLSKEINDLLILVQQIYKKQKIQIEIFKNEENELQEIQICDEILKKLKTTNLEKKEIDENFKKIENEKKKLKINNLEKEFENLIEMKEKYEKDENRFHDLEKEILNFRNKLNLMEIEDKQNKKEIEIKKGNLENIEKQNQEIENYQIKIKNIKKEILNLQQEKNDLIKQKEQKIVKLDLLETYNKNNVEIINKKLDEIEKNQNKLNEVQIEIKSYENDVAKHENKLKQNSNTSEKKKQTQQILNEKQKLNNEFKEQINLLQNKQMNVKNKIYIQQINNEMKLLNDEFINLQTNQKENNSIENEVKIFKKNLEEINSEIFRSKGKIEENQNFLNDFKNSLNNSKFQNIEKKEENLSENCEKIKLILEDLNLYNNILEKTVLQYHTRKLYEINEALKILWQETYKNKDIEYIAIRCDDDDSKYNYKLVMCIQGLELDMRGRCSSGQRVITCIIIRLVFAEVFSIKCGMLTLDEPTTNLDHKNIEGLAESLANVIQYRKHQNNFQLVIITHDEHFVNLLTQRYNLSEHLIRVYKNRKGISQITPEKR